MDKDDNIINVYHILEGGYFPAHAIITLDTQNFEILRDMTDKIIWGKVDVPEITDNEYQNDDRINKQRDKTLRLNEP